MTKRSGVVASLVSCFVIALAIAACSSSKPPPPAPSSLTFTKDVEPIVREKCQTCHQENGIAPFPLVTYEQIKELGGVAKQKVVAREMPPWGVFADDDCQLTRPFKGDLRMTDEQIDIFARWVDGGMPRGEPAAEPATPVATPVQRGLSDKTRAYEIASQFEVPGLAKDDLRCFPFDPGFDDDDAWVAESLLIPGDPKVVHHALVYVDENREGIEKTNGSDSYPCFGGADLKKQSLLMAWSPGGTSTVYGDGAALRIPRGAHIVVQVHYHPLAQATTGRLSLELKTLPEKPARTAGFGLIGNAEGLSRLLPGPDDPPEGPDFLIPSNAKAHTETMEVVIPKGIRETRIAAAGAHMHWAGVGMKITVQRGDLKSGDPATECLLNEPKYDFNWQRTYAYDAPLAGLPVLRAGDKLLIKCTYNNSKDNPHIARLMEEARQTTPPAIHLGPDSRDEMCQAMVVFVDE